MTSPLDRARIERILAGLDPDDAVFISELIEPRSIARQRRLALRDDAVRELATLTSEPRLTIAAKAISRELARYLAGPWRVERDLSELAASAGKRRILLHRIARLNAGCGLQWRALFDVLQRTALAAATEPQEADVHDKSSAEAA